MIPAFGEGFVLTVKGDGNAFAIKINIVTRIGTRILSGGRIHAKHVVTKTGEFSRRYSRRDRDDIKLVNHRQHGHPDGTYDRANNGINTKFLEFPDMLLGDIRAFLIVARDDFDYPVVDAPCGVDLLGGKFQRIKRCGPGVFSCAG